MQNGNEAAGGDGYNDNCTCYIEGDWQKRKPCGNAIGIDCYHICCIVTI